MAANQNFFYSNLFLALITLVVGLFGFILYLLNKNDFKRRTARIILLEITNAEAQLRDARNRLKESDRTNSKMLPEHLYTMPLDTWTSNRHLFVNDFKTNEWEAINEFYDKCQLFDEAIKQNDSRFAKEEQQIREYVHKTTYEFAQALFQKLEKTSDDDKKEQCYKEFFEQRNRFADFITNGNNLWIYTPSKDLGDVEYILSVINYDLSTSSVGTKLSKLANGRFWRKK